MINRISPISIQFNFLTILSSYLQNFDGILLLDLSPLKLLEATIERKNANMMQL